MLRQISYFHQIWNYSSIFMRSYASKRIRRNFTNPGISKQLKEFQEIPEFLEDPESFGDLETDFMNTHKSHKQYEKEREKLREKIILSKMKRKYFKEEQLPNFLTYAEKEQIKLLHNRNPDEWTLEKLSEGFPATADIIRKIVKSKWTAASKQRIIKHDENVMKNWSLYKAGKLKLNDNLKAHLDRFTDRKFEDLKNMPVNWDLQPLRIGQSKRNPFSDTPLISGRISENDQTENNVMTTTQDNETSSTNYHIEFSGIIDGKTHPGEKETYLADKVVDRRYMRLEDAKRLNKLPFEYVSEFDAVEENHDNKHNINEIVDEEIISTNDVLSLPKCENNKEKINEVEVSETDTKTYQLTPIKEKIRIPQKLRKIDAIYKVSDCYYDNDGLFLYRVPGMTGEKSS